MKHLKTFEQSKVKSLELFDAIKYNDLKKVKELLKHPDIDLNIKYKYGEPALIKASNYGYLEIVKELLKHPNIDVNIQNKYGNTALILASMFDKLEIIKELLKQPNINWNIQNKYDNDFLYYLKTKYQEEIKNLYPEKYKKYLFNKKIDDYNL